MFQAYKKFWQGAFTFNKKTNRKDFWLAMLTHLIIFVILWRAHNYFNLSDYFQLTILWQTFASFFQFIFFLYFLGSLLPFLALTVRRLNDADLPWGLIFLNFIVGIGSFVLLILNLFPSSVKESKFQEYEIANLKKLSDSGEIKTFSNMLSLVFLFLAQST